AVALLGTVLAANVSLLDPQIKALQPVLRSNYWLTIHVLTEVSSYAAFALAMGLGLIATLYYLTATYRRSPSFAELSAPLLAGVPMLLLGGVGVYASYAKPDSALLASLPFFYVTSIIALVGGSLTVAALFSMFGELAQRRPARALVPSVVLFAVGTVGFVASTLGLGSEWLVSLTGWYTTLALAATGLAM